MPSFGSNSGSQWIGPTTTVLGGPIQATGSLTWVDGDMYVHSGGEWVKTAPPLSVSDAKKVKYLEELIESNEELKSAYGQQQVLWRLEGE